MRDILQLRLRRSGHKLGLIVGFEERDIVKVYNLFEFCFVRFCSRAPKTIQKDSKTANNILFSIMNEEEEEKKVLPSTSS